MIYEASALPIIVFLVFVAVTLGLSFYLGSRAKSSAGYFTAHGQIPWFINGVAFAGDYLSAASFLGICGMIAFYGYDGFLYSIGFLAGWIVALFVVAEPLKRLGKFTFADALDAKFQSKGIKFVVGVGTLVVSIFYLIPQMVGAGVLVQPLLGLPHWVGVVMVGAIVITIVVTAGMVSTTWVQFLKGSLLVVFSLILTVMLWERGFSTQPAGEEGHSFKQITLANPALLDEPGTAIPNSGGWETAPTEGAWRDAGFVQLRHADTERITTFHVRDFDGEKTPFVFLEEAQSLTVRDGVTYVNGERKGTKKGEPELHPIGRVSKLPADVKANEEGVRETGPVGPLEFFSTLQESEVVLWQNVKVTNDDGTQTTLYYQKPTPGSQVLRPGEHPKFRGIRSGGTVDKLNFLSLMLALFCGTASLPHILIRYYTVKDEQAARKSTIVGIFSIGFFYILTLYLGLGAMTSGAMDVTNSNMAAPLLAKSMNEWLFAAISAIAFTTVLGTVSGLILASAGAVTQDLMTSVGGMTMTDEQQVRFAKITSVGVGLIAIVLGILFKELNVGYLVGWAFSIAASANLPSLMMLLFWKRTTKQGIIAAVTVGMISSLGWILLSDSTYKNVYGWDPASSIIPFDQPGIVTIPLGFLTLIVVSLLTARPTSTEATR